MLSGVTDEFGNPFESGSSLMSSQGFFLTTVTAGLLCTDTFIKVMFMSADSVKFNPV